MRWWTQERSRTAAALGEREEEFMRLKVEGILECGELLVAGLAPDRDKHVFGRRTMPEMDLASVACAIQNMWLAARAESVGMGWVSLFEPEALRELLRMPAGAKPVAVLCLGRVPEFYPRPMLEMNQWAVGCGLASLVHTDYWGERAIDPPRDLRQRSSHDKFPRRGLKGNSGSMPGLPPQL